MTLHKRATWAEYGLELARAAATRSACSRDQVGAVILDSDHRVIGTGYNGLPSGFTECADGGCPRGASNSVRPDSDYTSIGPGYCPAGHAEVNALLNVAGAIPDGSVMVTTRPPCSQCWAVLAASRIALVMYAPYLDEMDPRQVIQGRIELSFGKSGNV